jgi:gas vesicle protein
MQRITDEPENEGGSEVSTRLTYLLIGGGIGALLALLFAPKSGQELRGDIADATRKSLDRGRELGGQLGTRAGEYYEATKERASGLYSSAADKAGEYAGAAREVVSRKGGQLSAAIEAGKQAYTEEKRKTELTGLESGGPNYEGSSRQV